MIKVPRVWNLSSVDGRGGKGMLSPRKERRCDQGDRALRRARTDAAGPKEKGTAHKRPSVCVCVCAGCLG